VSVDEDGGILERRWASYCLRPAKASGSSASAVKRAFSKCIASGCVQQERKKAHERGEVNSYVRSYVPANNTRDGRGSVLVPHWTFCAD